MWAVTVNVSDCEVLTFAEVRLKGISSRVLELLWVCRAFLPLGEKYAAYALAVVYIYFLYVYRTDRAESRFW